MPSDALPGRPPRGMAGIGVGFGSGTEAGLGCVAKSTSRLLQSARSSLLALLEGCTLHRCLPSKLSLGLRLLPPPPPPPVRPAIPS